MQVKNCANWNQVDESPGYNIDDIDFEVILANEFPHLKRVKLE
mgnify:CR=1 FL=1